MSSGWPPPPPGGGAPQIGGTPPPPPYPGGPQGGPTQWPLGYGPPTGYPYAAPAPRTNGFSIASLVLGILGVWLLAVIFGHIALHQIPRRGQTGRGMAIAGLVLGYLWLVLIVIVVGAAVARSSPSG